MIHGGRYRGKILGVLPIGGPDKKIVLAGVSALKSRRLQVRGMRYRYIKTQSVFRGREGARRMLWYWLRDIIAVIWLMIWHSNGNRRCEESGCLNSHQTSTVPKEYAGSS